jgi:hypothetical protein
MHIDRSNYEIWLIDMLEGNLSVKEAEEVSRFLEMNPDIREEFDDLKSPQPELRHDDFKNKNTIRKSVADIHESQFELLCAAYLENDLQPESKAELLEMADSAPERRRTLELMKRTRLIPSPILFKRKSLLFRTTPLQRFYRLAAIGLSAAAAIAFFVIIFPGTSHILKDNKGNFAQISPVYPELKTEYFEIRAGSAIRIYSQVILQNEKSPVPVQIYTAELSQPDTTQTKPIEISIPDVQAYMVYPVKVTLTADLGLEKSSPSSLAPSSTTYSMQTDEDEMSNVERFVTKLFREKILRKDVADETPLKGYEIAEAGVAGLNLLFGWEMALNEKNDENGKLTSVSFSSKILKFNAPVKKN